MKASLLFVIIIYFIVTICFNVTPKITKYKLAKKKSTLENVPVRLTTPREKIYHLEELLEDSKKLYFFHYGTVPYLLFCEI